VEASAKAYIAAVSQMINAQPDIPLAGMSFTSRWS
jgi:hypothetical protein